MLVLLASAFLIAGTDRVAAAQNGDYTYTVSGTAATITGYTGAGGTITIPSTLGVYNTVTIGSKAFFQKTSLISVTIPATVKSIGNSAFSSCTAMTSMYFEGNAPTTGTSWISNHNAALIIYYYQGKTGFSTPTWQGVPTVVLTPLTDFDYQLINGGTAVQITGYHGAGVNFNIPGMINGKPVTSIGSNAFSGKISLTSVIMPATVTSIGEYAFYGCGLISVTIPGSVTSIGNYAFSSCTAMTSMYFEGNAPTTGTSWISNHNAALIIYYYQGKTGFSTPTWNGVPTMVLTPATDFDYQLINGGTAVQITGYHGAGVNVNIPGVINGKPVTSVGDKAFYKKTSLTSVAIPGSVRSIGNYSFYYCSSLTSVTTLGSVTSIGSYVFDYCTSLTSVTVLGSVRSIGDYSFFSCTSLSSVTIPGSVTSIGARAFSYCTSLTSITIPGSVTSIGNYAFSSCTAMTSITIPGSVTSIGNYAFSSCTAMTSMYFEGNAPTTGTSWISNHNAALIIYYYQGKTGFSTPTWQGVPTVVLTPVDVPSVPQNLVATGGNAQVTLTWSPSSSKGGSPIAGYKVYRGMTSGGETLLTTLANVLTYTDTSVTNGQTYYYKLSAVNGVGEGSLSNEASATPATVPSTPQNLVATGGNAQVTLTWSAPASNGGSAITGYKIYRGMTSGGETLLTTLGNTLFYTDTGLTNGQIYYYKVSAVNSKGIGPLSNELSANPSTIPSAPQTLTATEGNGQVVLTWSAPSSNGGSMITGYEIYKGTTSGGETLLTTLGNVLTYADNGLTNGQAYFYTVSAVNSVGEGPLSNEVSAIPTAVPTAPQSLVATRGNAQITLTWTAPVNDGGSPITAYKVYRGTTSGGETLLTSLDNVLTYTDTGLTNGQAYYYKVSAVNAVGEGPQSNEAFATPATVPTAPRSLAAIAGSAQVTLTWSAPANDGGSVIITYSIYRGTTPSTETFLRTVGNVLISVDTGLTNDQIYYYKISSNNSVGEGARSDEACATPATVPTTPRGFQAVPGDSVVDLNWTAPSYAGPGTLTYYMSRDGSQIWSGTGLAYSDTAVTNGIAYSYKLAAQNSIGWGPNCTAVQATPHSGVTVPTAPRGLTATAGDSHIDLNWTAPSSDGGDPITNYKVYQGSASGGEVLLTTIGNVLVYSDTSVTNGQIYYYKVSAVNAVGEGAQSNEVFATPATLPNAPQSLTATRGNAQVTLAWAAPASNGASPITNYRIYRGTTSGGETFLTVLGNVLTYTDTGITNGQKYYYVVSAVNAVGEGPFSNEASATPAFVPTTPTLSSATPGNAQIVLAWSAPSSNGGSPITNYKIYRGATSGGETLLITLGNVLTYTDTSVTNGQTYYYKVSAVNAVGESPLSNEVSATPAAVPSAPQNLVAMGGNTQITLTWVAPSSNGGSPITNFKIYRGTASGGETLLTTLGNVITYTDTSLTNDQVYYYKVSAVNGVGESAQSSETSAVPSGDSFPIIGYALSPTVLSETFTQAPSGLTLSADNAQYAYTEEGLKITLNQGSSALYIQNSDISGNSVRCIVDASSVDLTHVLSLWANFNVISHPGWYYSVKIMLDYDRVYLSPYVWLGSGTPSFSKAVYVYDVRERGTLDILVKVENGNIIVGMDGFESTLKTDYKIFTNLGFDGVTLASESDAWSSPADVVLHRLEIGNNAQIVYHDRLHKTITPWGHDFTLALQIHADDANPAQLALMKYLADNYGVRGEFAAWMDIEDPTSQYSVTDDANYANALHALQSSGWDIGLHAVTDLDTTRAELISLIDQFETEFGPLNSWVDHGNDAQDLYRYGNDPSSSYYISDVLQAKNVMIWVNLESQSQSKAYDLNLDTVMYHNALFPGLDLQKASKDGFPYEELGGWQPIKPVTQDMMSERQRIYASNSAVLLWHDYTLGFTYVEDGGISYSTQSNANMGYPYTLITQSQLYDKGAYVHPSGTWHLKPLAVDYFAAMHQDYDVWYATPREVYDRSIIMDQLIINEGSTTLTITNPTASNLLGLTLFTKEMPSYCLKNGETYYYAHQGAENYQFIIPDVQAGATIVLSKTVLPPSTLLVNEGSATVKTLGNQSELEPMANGDGTVTMSLNVSQGDGEVIVDLSNGQEVPNSVQVSMPVIEGTSMLSTRDDPP